jgi:hypothetical protein
VETSHFYDFAKLRVQRKGLLEEVLRGESLPLNTVESAQTLRMLFAICRKKEARDILGTPSRLLSKAHILRLYNMAEDAIQKADTITTKNAVSTQYRCMFSRSECKIGNGEAIKDIEFQSRFRSSNHHEVKAGRGVLNPAKLIVVDHDDHASLQDKVLFLMKEDLSSIENACWKSIEQFKGAKRSLELAREAYLSAYPDPFVAGARILHEHKLGRKMWQLHQKQFYEYAEATKRIDWKPKTPSLAAVLDLPPFADDVSDLFANLKVSVYETFFVEFYLPKAVIEAAEILFLIYTGWNPDTVISITPRDIQRGADYFDMVSIKSKNGQLHSKRVIRRENPRFYELIELLLWHNKNIDEFWVRADSSLFATWSLKNQRYAFRTMSDSMHIQYLVEPYGLPHFAKKQLRDQAANILYLTTNDPFLVKEHLGQGDIHAILAYLNQHVIRVLSEANIRRFQDRMAATIVWTAGGDQAVEKRGFKKSDVDSHLLFPVGDQGTESQALCDQWISSLGTMKLRIGLGEIEYLKFQINYYTENLQRLKQNNPKRFLLYHVPRLVFCAALTEIVRHSQFAHLLESNRFPQL